MKVKIFTNEVSNFDGDEFSVPNTLNTLACEFALEDDFLTKREHAAG